LPLLDNEPHCLRRAALHLPARRSRQNVNLFLRGPLGTERTEPIAGKKEEPRGGTETILLVEDEISVLTLTKTILERLGHIILTANSPRVAY
jgi:hypothetical protein